MLGAACGPMRFLLGVVILAMGVSGLAAPKRATDATTGIIIPGTAR